MWGSYRMGMIEPCCRDEPAVQLDFWGFRREQDPLREIPRCLKEAQLPGPIPRSHVGQL